MHKIDPAALSRKNLALLIVFDVVAEMRSVTLAAERLSLSQPALSHSLGKLRQLFGDRLFVRGRGTLMLTPRAEALAPAVRRLLANATSILRPVRPDPATFDRDLRIAVSDTCRLALGETVLRRVRERAPGLRLHVGPLEAGSEVRLAEGALDLVIGKEAPVPRALRSIEIHRDRLVGVVAASHALAGRARANAVTLDAWIAHPHVAVSMPGVISDRVGAALAALGIRRPIGERATSFVQALSSVAGQSLVAAVPTLLVAALRPSLPDLVTFDLPVRTAPVRQRLVWHPSTDSHADLSWLRETIRAVVHDAVAADRFDPVVPPVAARPAPAWPLPPGGDAVPIDRPNA